MAQANPYYIQADVSIPDRDFNRFQRTRYALVTPGAGDVVSIPDRDFNRFQLKAAQVLFCNFSFQSLIGILIDFNLKSCHVLALPGLGFNP